MASKDRIYNWWKAKHDLIRKPVVFIIGIVLVITAPLVGVIPGPGGMVVFLFGIAILASEFEWAHQLKSFFVTAVPKKVKQHWQPTPNWEYSFDVTTACLAVSATIFGYYAYWLPCFYTATTAILIFVFNRSRLPRLRKRLAKNQN